MLRAFIAAQHAPHAQELERILQQSGRVLIVKQFTSFPDPLDLLRAIRAHSPQVIFLDFSAPETALALARRIEQVEIVGFVYRMEPELLLRLMQQGVRELLIAPFSANRVDEVLTRVEERCQGERSVAAATEFVFSFLPAKPGDGASLLAANAALQASAAVDGQSLFADLDLRTGMSRFLLKLPNAFATVDALEKAKELDESIWPDLVSQLGEFHVLGAGEHRRTSGQEAAQIRHVLEFARARYRLITMDHSGALEDFSLEALQESRRIFLVITPELPSIYLAREKLRLLKSLDLEDRLLLILNRWRKGAPLSMPSIEEVLGHPIHQSLPDDRESVAKSMMAGEPVDPESPLGMELGRLGRSMLESKAIQKEPPKRRIEYFALSPARHSFLLGGR